MIMLLANTVPICFLTVVGKLLFVLSICLDKLTNICQQLYLLHQLRKTFSNKIAVTSIQYIQMSCLPQKHPLTYHCQHLSPPSAVKICFENKCHLPFTYSSVTRKHTHSTVFFVLFPCWVIPTEV